MDEDKTLTTWGPAARKVEGEEWDPGDGEIGFSDLGRTGDHERAQIVMHFAPHSLRASVQVSIELIPAEAREIADALNTWAEWVETTQPMPDERSQS